jgi:hypothetical protein
MLKLSNQINSMQMLEEELDGLRATREDHRRSHDLLDDSESDRIGISDALGSDDRAPFLASSQPDGHDREHVGIEMNSNEESHPECRSRTNSNNSMTAPADNSAEKQHSHNHRDGHHTHDHVHGTGSPGDSHKLDKAAEKPKTASKVKKLVKLYGPLVFYFVCIVVYFIVGTAVYCSLFDWNIVDSLYFVTITVLGIGYGDISPVGEKEQKGGTIFTIFFILGSFFFIISLVNHFIFQMIEVVDSKMSDVVSTYLEATEKTLQKAKSMKIIRQASKKASSSKSKRGHSRRASIGQSFHKGVISVIKKADAKGFILHMNNMHRFRLLKAIGMFLLTIFLGAVVFYHIEPEWSYLDSVYWCVCTATTVGYGDLDILNPEKTHGFTIFYALTSVVSMSYLLGEWSGVTLEVHATKRREKLLNRALDKSMIFEFDTDGDKRIDMMEFVLGMLHRVGKIDRKKDVEHWIKRFKDLDVDNSGYLDEQDLREMEGNFEPDNDSSDSSDSEREDEFRLSSRVPSRL